LLFACRNISQSERFTPYVRQLGSETMKYCIEVKICHWVCLSKLRGSFSNLVERGVQPFKTTLLFWIWVIVQTHSPPTITLHLHHPQPTPHFIPHANQITFDITDMNPPDNTQQSGGFGFVYQQCTQARSEEDEQARRVKSFQMQGFTQQPMNLTDSAKPVEAQADLQDLEFHLEGPDGKDYSNKLRSGLKFEELGLYVSITL
jgi:hypothetical protein